MGALPIWTSRSLFGFCVTLLVISSCYCDDVVRKSVQVVGIATCSDCTQSNLLSTHALSGLRVTIDCKLLKKGELQTRGEGKLDEQGKFKVILPSEILKEGSSELKEECFAQLHSASNALCSTQHGIEAAKLTLKSKDVQIGTHTFSTTGKIAISPITCASAFFWPHYKYPPLPTLPPHPWFKKDHPWFKKKPLLPKYKLPHFPPLTSYFPPHPPKEIPPLHPPVYEKPPPVPVPTPVVPVYKPPVPAPTPVVPVYKPPVPAPTPVVPVYKPPVPAPTPTPVVPVYKPPVPAPTPVVPVHKPKKKPCPPKSEPKTPSVPAPVVPVYKPPPVPEPEHKPKKKPCPPKSEPKVKTPTPKPTPKVKTPSPKPTPVPVYTPKPQPPPVPVPVPVPVNPTPTVKPPPVDTPTPTPNPVVPYFPAPHPIFNKPPCPPFPKLPPFPKIPPKYLHPIHKLPPIPPKFLHPKIPKKFLHMPKIPKKFFHHPKYGKWPPIPPYTSHP
ncbi:hypothetical protein MKX01_007531 [Papaver californicum]|nr:hypothetical protein MKX01_007531 [Papaver californicum]